MADGIRKTPHACPRQQLSDGLLVSQDRGFEFCWIGVPGMAMIDVWQASSCPCRTNSPKSSREKIPPLARSYPSARNASMCRWRVVRAKNGTAIDQRRRWKIIECKGNQRCSELRFDRDDGRTTLRGRVANGYCSLRQTPVAFTLAGDGWSAIPRIPALSRRRLCSSAARGPRFPKIAQSLPRKTSIAPRSLHRMNTNIPNCAMCARHKHPREKERSHRRASCGFSANVRASSPGPVVFKTWKSDRNRRGMPCIIGPTHAGCCRALTQFRITASRKNGLAGQSRRSRNCQAPNPSRNRDAGSG